MNRYLPLLMLSALLLFLTSCRSWEVALEVAEDRTGTISFSYVMDNALLREKGLDGILEKLPVNSREDFAFLNRYYDGVELRFLSIWGTDQRAIKATFAFENLESLNVLLNDVGLAAVYEKRASHSFRISRLDAPKEVQITEGSRSIELAGSEDAAYIFPMMQLLFPDVPTTFSFEAPRPIWQASRGSWDAHRSEITGPLSVVMGPLSNFSWEIRW